MRVLAHWDLSIYRIRTYSSPNVRNGRLSDTKSLTHEMHALLSASGVLILVSGGCLAHLGSRNFERQKNSDRVAGFLIMIGLSCIGLVLGLLFGAPLP